MPRWAWVVILAACIAVDWRGILAGSHAARILAAAGLTLCSLALGRIWGAWQNERAVLQTMNRLIDEAEAREHADG